MCDILLLLVHYMNFLSLTNVWTAMVQHFLAVIKVMNLLRNPLTTIWFMISQGSISSFFLRIFTITTLMAYLWHTLLFQNWFDAFLTWSWGKGLRPSCRHLLIRWRIDRGHWRHLSWSRLVSWFIRAIDWLLKSTAVALLIDGVWDIA